MFDRLGELAGLPARVLIGDLDLPPAVDCAERTAERLGCGPDPVPGADHLLPLRAPGALVAAVLAAVPHGG
ncbi:hypothetical protein [Kitasatospora sp. NPDC057198]|uniref:hypothetical protein n=1 Tax=Kitasatospora sp. NPDC057198 TaxID=3346046 RepID=UPI00363FDFA4